MKRAISLSFFFSMKLGGSKPFTSPAKRDAVALVGVEERDGRGAALARRAATRQVSSVPIADRRDETDAGDDDALHHADRRASHSGHARRGCGLRGDPRQDGPQVGFSSCVLLDVVDGVLDGADLLRVLVRDVDLEGLFEREDQLDQTERICPEVVDERGLGLDVLLVDVELLLDDALDLGRDVPAFRH